MTRPRHAKIWPVLLCTTLAASAGAQSQPGPDGLDCTYLQPVEWNAALQSAAAQGLIPGPGSSELPAHPFPQLAASVNGTGLTPAHIFTYEDTSQVMLTDYSLGELFFLMISASNAVTAMHGDNYDFIGYWVNFAPHHQLGDAFYASVQNDVLGIGDPSGMGTPIYNSAAAAGLAGSEIEGFVMMWNINSTQWAGGTGSNAEFTRLALGQEYGHRFGMFLPDLLDGRVLRGDDSNCGRVEHWSWRVDGQGSSMEIAQWAGANPAHIDGTGPNFNSDIPGGVFSYSDLYLMGYVSGAEMDAGNSQLRFMDNSANCGVTYNGPISSFSSVDIIASAGPRIPASVAEDKHYRTAWIMLHLPGAAPTTAQLNKAVNILETHQDDWEYSTLGRGSMSNALFPDCNGNDLSDTIEIAQGFVTDANANGIPDDCECLVESYCMSGPNSAGAPALISTTGSTSIAANDFGLFSIVVPGSTSGLFLYGPDANSQVLGNGTLCISGSLFRLGVTTSDPFGFSDYQVDFTNPPQAAGAITAFSTWRFQHWFRDPAAGGAGFDLSDAVRVTFCP